MTQVLKTYFMVCILSLAQMFAIASEDKTITNAKMTRVELYRNGAQVYKQFKLNTAQRVSTVRVKSIPTDIDPKTIRAKALGKQKIVSLHFETDYSISEKDKKLSMHLRDSIEQADLNLSLLDAEIQALELQELMINQNTRILENNRGIDDLQKALQFQRTELTGLKKQLVKLTYQRAELSKKKAELSRRAQQSHNYKNSLAGVIVMEIVAEPNQTHNIEISYLVADAWWSPVYDIRVESIEEPLELEYRAEVYQNTHEDWNDVKLLLFSNNPQEEGELGELRTWNLNYNSTAPSYERNTELLVPASQMTESQSGISGVITEESNGQPIAFANVVLKRNGAVITGTQSDFDGKFHINNVQPGFYDFEISSLGFNNLEMKDLKLNPRNMASVDVSMATSAVELSEVIIQSSAKTTAQRVTSQAIRKITARSPAQMAATVGGTYGKDDGSGSINVRGSRNDANYYYIDGIKVGRSLQKITGVNQNRVNTLFLNDENQQEELRIEYEAPGKQTVPSTDKIKSVYLKSREVDAHYVYRAVPRIDSKVYLYAELTNWESLGLQTGKTNLFYTNIYIGEANINVTQTNDTLSLSLGPDRNIILSSERTHQAENTPSFGSYSLQQEFKIELKSLKSYPVNIRLEDQIPVAASDNFSVELQESSDGKLDKDSGIITWEFELGAQEKATKTYKYLVKYPRGVRIAVN